MPTTTIFLRKPIAWRDLITPCSLLILFFYAFVAANPTHAFDLPGFSKTIVPSGQIKIEQREVADFNGVALGLPGTLEVKQGTSEGITIESDDNIIPLIRTTVENGILQIRWESNGIRIQRNSNGDARKISIVVNAINLTRLSIGGSGVIIVPTLQTTNLSVSVGGSGNIRLEQLSAQKLSTDIGGSGSLYAKGTVASLSGAIGGSGSIRAERLNAAKVNLSIGGSGGATVWARETLSIAIAGSGSVQYYGDPKVSTAKAGSGSVQRLGAAP
jgi:hypothetical protein